MAKPKKKVKAKITTFKKTKPKLRIVKKQKIEPALKFPVVTLDMASLGAIRNIVRTELDLMLKSAQEIDNRKVQAHQIAAFEASGGVIGGRDPDGSAVVNGAAKKESDAPFA